MYKHTCILIMCLLNSSLKNNKSIKSFHLHFDKKLKLLHFIYITRIYSLKQGFYHLKIIVTLNTFIIISLSRQK